MEAAGKAQAQASRCGTSGQHILYKADLRQGLSHGALRTLTRPEMGTQVL